MLTVLQICRSRPSLSFCARTIDCGVERIWGWTGWTKATWSDGEGEEMLMEFIKLTELD